MENIVFTQVSQKCKHCTDRNLTYYIVTDSYLFRVYGYFNRPVKPSREFCYIYNGKPCQNNNCDCGTGYSIHKLTPNDIKQYIEEEEYEENEDFMQSYDYEDDHYGDTSYDIDTDTEEEDYYTDAIIMHQEEIRFPEIKNNNKISTQPLKQNNNLNIFKAKKNMGVCSICLEQTKQNDDICVLNCCHMFHHNCILKWIKCKRNCPLCRESI